MKLQHWAALAFAGTVTAGFVATFARAQSVPASPTLSYSGFIEDNGVPIDGSRQVNVTVVDPGNGATLCTTGQQSIVVRAGHFVVPLPSTCDVALRARGDAAVEVDFAGTTLPRQPIGAVPFALTAEQSFMQGAVIFFNRPTCPQGWAVFTPLLGRYAVGVDAGVGLTVGTPLAPAENRETGMHTHAVNDPGHTHSIPHPLWVNVTESGFDGANIGMGVRNNLGTSRANTGLTVADAGTVAGTNAPYVGLLPCQKL